MYWLYNNLHRKVHKRLPSLMISLWQLQYTDTESAWPRSSMKTIHNKSEVETSNPATRKKKLTKREPKTGYAPMLLALWAALLQCCQVNPCMNTEGYLSFFLFFFFFFLVSEDMLTIYISCTGVHLIVYVLGLPAWAPHLRSCEYING